MQVTVQSCRALGALSARLVAQGLAVAESDDFAAFKARYEPVRRIPVNPIFDVDRQAVDGFWLAIEDHAGRCCGIQAVRFLGQSSPNLRAHLAAHLDDFVALDHGMDPAKSIVVSEAARAITGTLCYHGEFYIVPDRRGQGLAALTIRLAELVAWLRWAPGCFFGITVPATSTQTFAGRMGYGAFERRAIHWRDGAGNDLYDEGLVWSEPAHLDALMHNPFLGIRARVLSPVGE